MASVGKRKRFPIGASSGADEKETTKSILRELKQHHRGFFYPPCHITIFETSVKVA
jgi:hypothetical protein